MFMLKNLASVNPLTAQDFEKFNATRISPQFAPTGQNLNDL
jgi:hypothetical protein